MVQLEREVLLGGVIAPTGELTFAILDENRGDERAHGTPRIRGGGGRRLAMCLGEHDWFV
jgi:hypothetical protein